MFIVSLSYIKPIEEIDKHLAAHVDYLKQHYEKKSFIASGRKVPRTGGIILSNLESKSELERILQQDPFSLNKVAEFEIIEFVPSMTLPEFSNLLPD
ncbi:MAG: GTP cyclohydrolase [Desulfuromonadales bacterium C00003068]|jgi:uncharacterized protein YciI|nr:YciI family protein [Deltaproteobacteria bacterium]OEU72484.1 MAG: GTP cyclohydrolase [Desulfuromonadales bacterium C00003068]